MNYISHYTLLEKIGDGVQTEIYKGYYTSMPHRLLAIKVIKSTSISESQKKYFRQKIEHLKVLPDERLMAPLTFYEDSKIQIITRAYFEGIPLNQWVESCKKISLDDFLSIAIDLSDLIEKTHNAGIIHGGIKPHNILINPKTLEIRIVDFITPLDVRNVSHFIYNQKFIQGTLAYTSPEQTGRINHRVEFTTDIYSLGVIFYEMLTRKLPFQTNDPLELIHSHLAEEAPYAHELNNEIPEMLGLIINKMLLKQPEKRYQRGKGLSVDLIKFRARLHEGDPKLGFNLGLEDRSHRINFISKMVGRDREAQVILNEYQEVAHGEFKALLISGYSGIGKTRLIQELQKPIVRNKGYFTSGKFDVYQKNIPYSSLIQAFRNLTRVFLTESDDRVESWKKKIMEAVGTQGKVITDVIPELQVLIGPQPSVLDLPPVEARNRFLDVFNRFLTCLATADSPLVLFIDDLQWCDIASFEFLTNLFKNCHEHPYLLLLGAFRHNEVDPSHPLTKLVKYIKDERKPLREIHLGPILDQHSHEMVSYILDSSMEQTEALGLFLAKLTEGNPLFVSESLSYLYNENLLFFDEKNGQWSWNMDQIKNSQMPSSVVSLFSSKVHKLPPSTFDLLKYCACMGNLFTPDELSLVKEISLLDVFETLKPALGQGLLIENKDQMQFVHDKVQEATLACIDRDRRQSIHTQVGYHLLQNIPPNIEYDKLENIFTIASHLNIAGRLSEENGKALAPEFKELLSKVNYFAGNSALNSLATDAANEYYNLSRKMLSEDAWDKNYEQTFRIFQKLAKTELMVGRSESSEKLLNELLDHAKSDLDKAEALSEQTTSLSSIGNFIKAIETANRGLSYFGKDIPLDNEVAQKRCDELMTKIHSDGKDVWSTILNMPFTHERKSKIELAFYSELIPDLYMSGLVPQLYLAAAQSTQNCLEGGMDESVIYSFSIMGLNLGEKHQFKEAFKYEDLARELSERHPNTFGATRGMNGVVWCNMHSRNRPQEIVDYCLKSIQSGRNCGDLYNAGLSYGPLMWNLQAQGAKLSELETYANECYQFSKKFNLSFSVGLAEAVKTAWIDPMKLGYKPRNMNGKIRNWKESNHIASIGSYYVLLGISHYYFEKYEDAHENLEIVNEYLHGLTDNVLKRQWYIFRMLTAVKMFELGKGFKTESELQSFCDSILKDVRAWTELGPLLRPYLKLFEAEKLRQEKGIKVALSTFLEAQQLAQDFDYGILEAHICEMIGKSLKKANMTVGVAFLREAFDLFENLEITRKAFHLSGLYPEIDASNELNFPSLEKKSNSALLPVSEKSLIMDLDIEYLIKSNLAISAEINKDRLFKKILNVILESSGAQYGCLLIEKKGELYIVSESQVKDKSEEDTQIYSLEESKNISKSVIRYVHRTLENIILNNALEEGLFKDYAEVQELGMRSVFCYPIVQQSKLMGIVYLENRLVPSSFSKKDLEMIKLLASQISISIENANLIEDMRNAEKVIKASLMEKEVLLKEVHHRVKNNLQIINSLFNMQSKKIQDPIAKEAFVDSQNRVRSMALIHEKLYEDKNLSQVDVAGYIRTLTSNLVRAYGFDSKNKLVEINVKVENLNLAMDVVSPLGLILNELLTNCFKHAFHEIETPKIDISFCDDLKSGKINLKISDNGVGIPRDLNLRKVSTLGLLLVETLVKQLAGEVVISAEGGTQFMIILPRNIIE